MESLSSILSEMWADLLLGGGSSLLRDLEDLLQPAPSSYDSSFSPNDLQSELRLVDSALSSTSEHCTALQAQLTVESALLAAQEQGTRRETSPEGRLQELQAQLRQKETVTGLRARLNEAKVRFPPSPRGRRSLTSC